MSKTMSTSDISAMTGDEILERYAANEHRWSGWADQHIDFKVGYATAELHSAYQAFRTVYSVNVHVDHRGQGHGRLLMDVIVAYAEATGCGLNLSVYADNEAAIRLYASVGFRITHTHEAGHDEFGRPRQATHWMTRYPTRIPATPEWDRHFAAKLRRLEQDHEPRPEGPDEWAEATKAIRAAEEVAGKVMSALDRDRYTSSANYNANTHRMWRDAFGAALLDSGWTITRTD